MTTIVSCQSGCKGLTTHEAAKRLAKSKSSTAECSKCGKLMSIRIEQEYHAEKPPKTHIYDVVKVIRLYSDQQSEEQNPPFDPMMLFVHESDANKDYIWPIYWTKDRKGRWWWGQFPPMITADEFLELMGNPKD